MDGPEERGSPDRESAEPTAGPGASGSEPSEDEVRDEISREIHEIYEKSYGKGAGRCETLLVDGWVIVILDALELLPNEEFLIDNGKSDDVAHVRTQYQHAIQTQLRAAIERATGRNVIGFSSTTSLEDPRFAAEIFKLG